MSTDQTRQLISLAREGDKARRRVDVLEETVQALADTVTELAGPAGRGTGPVSWLLADDPDTGVDVLTDLAGWVEQVFLRYSGAELPSCWLWHPDVVEELVWLRGAHNAAYSGPAASWQRVADWHDRQRPGVVTRIRRAAGDCELDLHTAGADRNGPAPTAPLANTATAVAVAWTTERAQPEPTEQQLDQARRHDRAQHVRTNR